MIGGLRRNQDEEVTGFVKSQERRGNYDEEGISCLPVVGCQSVSRTTGPDRT